MAATTTYRGHPITVEAISWTVLAALANPSAESQRAGGPNLPVRCDPTEPLAEDLDSLRRLLDGLEADL